MKDTTSEALQQSIKELAASVRKLENESYRNDKDIGTSLLALITVLSEKGIITVAEVEREKKKFLKSEED